MSRTWLLSLLVALALSGGGCASTILLSHGITMPYRATRMDAHLATGGSPFDDDTRVLTWLAPIAAIDLPLTFAIDTITLPVVLPLYLVRGPQGATETGCWRSKAAAAAARERVSQGPAAALHARSHEEWVQYMASEVIEAADFDARHGYRADDEVALRVLDNLQRAQGISPGELIHAIRERAAQMDGDRRETAEETAARFERAAATVGERGR